MKGMWQDRRSTEVYRTVKVRAGGSAGSRQRTRGLPDGIGRAGAITGKPVFKTARGAKNAHKKVVIDR
jgi:hypothetical protein